jgi:methionine synthase II (cobalamin-independent)
MLGRTLSLITTVTGEFAAETTASGWRLSGGRGGAAPGRQMRRAAAWLAEDLDRLEEQLGGTSDPVKVQVAGPWTLAAGLEMPRMTRLVADAGACAGLAEALAEAVGGHVAQVARRLPGAELVLQVDEPTLPAVAAGRLRTASGRGSLRVPPSPELSGALALVTAAASRAGASRTLAHCCAGSVPFDLFADAGFAALSLDPAAVGPAGLDGMAGWWDRGAALVLGVAPVADPARSATASAGAPGALAESMARTVEALWRRAGFGIGSAGERTWLSTACGLAGATPGWARGVGALLRRTAGMLVSAD